MCKEYVIPDPPTFYYLVVYKISCIKASLIPRPSESSAPLEGLGTRLHLEGYVINSYPFSVAYMFSRCCECFFGD